MGASWVVRLARAPGSASVIAAAGASGPNRVGRCGRKGLLSSSCCCDGCGGGAWHCSKRASGLLCSSCRSCCCCFHLRCRGC